VSDPPVGNAGHSSAELASLDDHALVSKVDAPYWVLGNHAPEIGAIGGIPTEALLFEESKTILGDDEV
jgi:hypothetical protein